MDETTLAGEVQHMMNPATELDDEWIPDSAAHAPQESADPESDETGERGTTALYSIDEGLMELAEGDKTSAAEADSDRVAELEEKLASLSAETDDQAIVSPC